MYNLKCSVSVGCTRSQGLKNCEYGFFVDPNFANTLQEIKNAGIENIELCFMAGVYARGKKIVQNFKKALKIVKKSGLKLNSVHFPFGPAWSDLACPWEQDRVEIVRWFGSLFKLSDKLQPNAYVFHPGGIGVNENNVEFAKSQLYKTVNELALLTKTPICVENMVGGALMRNVQDILEFTKNADKGYSIIDVNHLLFDKPQDVIRAVGSKIKSLHISDYDFKGEKHWLPGEGSIDWQDVIKALEEVGYDGCFTYEVYIDRFGYTYKQIKENYDALFAEYNKNK
jgi:sugar phosphate isomerase/epimerase